MNSDCLFVTTHFNPCHWKRQKETYAEFYEKLPAYVQSNLICYEAVLPGDRPEIEGSTVITAYPDSAFLWQKEAILNYALEQCPKSVDYFFWLDHDIVFDTSNWYTRAAEMIYRKKACAVQLFNKVDYQRPDRKIEFSVPSIHVMGIKGNPGMA